MALPASPKPKSERSYRGVSITQRRAERREKLILAAVECFGTLGYHATTLKALCAQAGLTERYFYESFDNFEDLLCCSYEYSAERLLQQVVAAAMAGGADPLARARAAVDTYFGEIAANPARARLLLVEIEGASPKANEVYRRRLRMSADMILNDIMHNIPTAGRSRLSPQLLSVGLLGATYQLAKEWALSGFDQPRATIVRNAEAIFGGVIAMLLFPA